MTENAGETDRNGETWFWQVVQQARCSRSELYSILEAASREQIVVFHRVFKRAAHALWCYPYVDRIEDAAVDDHIIDILEWVVSQGQEHYFAVVADPSKMRTELVRGSDQDTFSGVVENVFFRRFGEFLPCPWTGLS